MTAPGRVPPIHYAEAEGRRRVGKQPVALLRL